MQKDGDTQTDLPHIIKDTSDKQKGSALVIATVIQSSGSPLDRADDKAKLVHRSAVSYIKQSVGVAKSQIVLDFYQALREAKRNTAQYLLGCGSVFVVVCIVAMLLTAISYSPSIFLSLAENNAGQIDFLISPRNLPINYTDLVLNYPDPDSFKYSTIRLVSSVVLAPASSCSLFSSLSPFDNNFTYTGTTPSSPQTNSSLKIQSDCQSRGGYACLNQVCSKFTQVPITLIDTSRESELGIGRQWNYPPVPTGSMYIHQRLAKNLALNEGDYAFISLNMTNVFMGLCINLAQRGNFTNMTSIHNWINLPLKVERIIDGNYGKYGQSTQDSIFIEAGYFQQYTASFLSPYYNMTSAQSYANLASYDMLKQSVNQVLVSCSSYRIGCYLSSYSTVSRNLINWASSIIFNADFLAVSGSLPVLSELSGTQSFTAFLNLIFNIVVLMMGGLSIFLIYSLLMVSVETKTFELGIFRMVGMSKWGVTSLIMVQSLMYAIPGWVLGLIVAQIAWNSLRFFLASLLQTEIGPYLESNAIGVSTTIGILVPIVAAILPIRNALTGNLHDALDMRHSKTKAVIVEIERTGAASISVPLFATGLVLTIAGFLIYYFLPMALLYRNITLLFNIFLILLIGMLLGLVMLSLNLQSAVEHALVFFFFSTLLYYESPSIPRLVLKNLTAHRIRNRKTAIMYAVALGFIIFITVSIRIELSSLIYSDSRSYGTPLRVVPNSNRLGVLSRDLLEYYCQFNSDIIGFTTKIADYGYIVRAQSTSISNLGGISTFPTYMASVAPNFYNIPDPTFTIVTSRDSRLNSAYTVSESLYLRETYMRGHMGSLYQSEFNLNSYDKQILFTSTFKNQSSITSSQNSLGYFSFLSSAPVLRFSPYPSVPQQNFILSHTSLLKLLNGSYKSIDDLPISNFLIKTRTGLGDAALNQIITDISMLVEPLDKLEYLENDLSGIKSASSTLNLIFQIVTVCALIVTFFSLNSSMVVNISEQSLEIGILRSLGLSKSQIFRLFAYEAFFLTMAAACLGILIGITVGWSMAAQRSVTTQIPIMFSFPTDIFGIIFGASMLCAIVSTLAPTIRLVYRRTIVSLLRG